MTVKCQCCLSSVDLVKLTERYAQMLMYCFRIEFPQKKLICNSCVEKVKETSAFRYLILVSQSKLKKNSSSNLSNIDDESESVTNILKTEPSYDSDVESFGNDRDNDDYIFENPESVKIDQEAKHESIPKHELPIITNTFSLGFAKDNSKIQINTKVESHTPILESKLPIKENLNQDEIMHDVKKSYIKKSESPKENLKVVESNRKTISTYCKPKLKSGPIKKKILWIKINKFDSKKSSIEENKLPKESSNVQTNIKDESDKPISKPDSPDENIFAPDNDCSTSDKKILPIRKKEKYQPRPFKLDKTALTCELCKETFVTHRMLQRHMAVHYPNFVCSECGKVFFCSGNLFCHLKTHNNMQVSCTVCNKKMKHTSLYTHMKMHSTNIDRKRYTCVHCSERFLSYSTRLIHMRDVHDVEIRRFQCELCPRKFPTCNSMKVHIRIDHNKEVRVFCDYCNMGFYNKSKLRKHMPRHTGEKNYICHICSKKYSRANALSAHLKTHPEVDKYSCSYCNKVYYRLKFFNIHMKTHENVNNE